MNNEISFETILRTGQPLVITDINQRENITFFKVNGHQFQTYGYKVHHKNSPMFDHPVTKIWASQENDPEEIVRHDKMMEEINNETDLWFKHRLSVFRITFVLAMKILLEKGEEEFLKFLDDHFCITPEGGSKAIISRLEKEK